MVTTASPSNTQLRANEDRMSSVLSETGPAVTADTATVTAGLTRPAAAVTAHSRIDTTIGILEDIVRQAPRFSADVETLDRDHRELPELLIGLRFRARQLESDIEEALHRLEAHQRLTLRLVYEAFNTDLGEGG